MKNFKFKLRSIWKSQELKVITLIFLLVVPIILVTFVPEIGVARNELTFLRIYCIVSLLLAFLLGSRMVLKDFFDHF